MKFFVFSYFAVFQLFCMAAYALQPPGMVKQNASPEVKRIMFNTSPNGDEMSTLGTKIVPSVKSVILMIGDGMGPQQIGLALMYAKHAPNAIIKNRKLNIEKVMDAGETGVVLVEPSGKIVVDSACSTTQFATGKAVQSETMGLDIDGNPIETILEKAKKAGKSTGIVSDTMITHATPAAFAAHVAHRSMENEIAEQLIESKVDIMLSGGIQYFLPMEVNRKDSIEYQEALALIQDESLIKSKRRDQKNLFYTARERGYELIFRKENLINSTSRKILGLFSRSDMPDGIFCSQTKEHQLSPPTLKEMTEKAISTLSTNRDGFFLMVEGGLIDYAGHTNDTGWMLHEMLKFDEAIGAVFDWIKDRKDTLLIITGDHETGSFGFSYSSNNLKEPTGLSVLFSQENKFQSRCNFGSYEVLDKIYHQKKTLTEICKMFDALPPDQKTPWQLQRFVNENLGFEITLEQAERILTEEVNPLYKKRSPYSCFETVPIIHDFKAFYPYTHLNRQVLISREIAEQQQVVWGTGTHTSTPVFVIAFGPEAIQNTFDGLWHSTEIGKKMIESMGF